MFRKIFKTASIRTCSLSKNRRQGGGNTERVMVRIGHGYFKGWIKQLPPICPTIDAHIACWHVLIGEYKMKECNCIGRLGGKYENCNDSARRVYDVNGCSPCLTTCGGGEFRTESSRTKFES